MCTHRRVDVDDSLGRSKVGEVREHVVLFHQFVDSNELLSDGAKRVANAVNRCERKKLEEIVNAPACILPLFGAPRFLYHIIACTLCGKCHAMRLVTPQPQSWPTSTAFSIPSWSISSTSWLPTDLGE